MIVAVREGEVFRQTDWQECFLRDIVGADGEILAPKLDLTKAPYSYQMVEVPDECVGDIRYTDFDIVGGRYIFDIGKYQKSRQDMLLQKEQVEYVQGVQKLIAERYSIADELALLRQQDSKTAEYQAYYDYCEQCKQICKAKA